MTAMDTALAGLIDYAGLYPPAALDMGAAARSYLDYSNSKHASALGRFIVDLNRLTALRAVAGDSLLDLRLSVICPVNAEWETLPAFIDEGFPIESIEIKTDQPSDIDRISRRIPSAVTAYFEVPAHVDGVKALDAISAARGRVKLRMGGVVAEAFPSAEVVAGMLKALSDRGLSFKATAGLHHPIRSRHPFTCAPDSPAGTMHGFVNLLCAAALIHCDGDSKDARHVLDEESQSAWQVGAETVGWRSFQWRADQLREVRQRFFISFGSCSFVEPMNDLEALGWL